MTLTCVGRKDVEPVQLVRNAFRECLRVRRSTYARGVERPADPRRPLLSFEHSLRARNVPRRALDATCGALTGTTSGVSKRRRIAQRSSDSL